MTITYEHTEETRYELFTRSYPAALTLSFDNASLPIAARLGLLRTAIESLPDEERRELMDSVRLATGCFPLDMQLNLAGWERVTVRELNEVLTTLQENTGGGERPPAVLLRLLLTMSEQRRRVLAAEKERDTLTAKLSAYENALADALGCVNESGDARQQPPWAEMLEMVERTRADRDEAYVEVANQANRATAAEAKVERVREAVKSLRKAERNPDTKENDAPAYAIAAQMVSQALDETPPHDPAWTWQSETPPPVALPDGAKWEWDDDDETWNAPTGPFLERFASGGLVSADCTWRLYCKSRLHHADSPIAACRALAAALVKQAEPEHSETCACDPSDTPTPTDEQRLEAKLIARMKGWRARTEAIAELIAKVESTEQEANP